MISNKVKIILIASGALGIILGSSGYLIHKNLHSKDQQKRNELILQQIIQIHSELESLMINPNDESKVITQVANNINDLKDIFKDAAKSTDVKNIATELTEVKSDMDNQFTSIMKSMLSSEDGKEYLDAGVLPFTVLSVDVIAGHPFLSVNLNNHIMPLSIGDTLAGFRLVDADFNLNTAEFVNFKNQYIKIKLSSIT